MLIQALLCIEFTIWELFLTFASKLSTHDCVVLIPRETTLPFCAFYKGQQDLISQLVNKLRLLLSICFTARQPSEVDPAVVVQDLPRPISEGEEVLARWSDDGWYYRGTHAMLITM